MGLLLVGSLGLKKFLAIKIFTIHFVFMDSENWDLCPYLDSTPDERMVVIGHLRPPTVQWFMETMSFAIPKEICGICIDYYDSEYEYMVINEVNPQIINQLLVMLHRSREAAVMPWFWISVESHKMPKGPYETWIENCSVWPLPIFYDSQEIYQKWFRKQVCHLVKYAATTFVFPPWDSFCKPVIVLLMH